MNPDDLLVGLNDAQHDAVVTKAAPLCILAGAGSGKTRVLTRRIAWRVSQETADASHVLALTFTRKAAGELRARLGALGVRPQVAAGTFHSIAYAQLRQYWADRSMIEPTLLDRKAGLLAGLVPQGAGIRGATGLADVAAEIEWAKARMIGPAAYVDAAARSARRPPMASSDMARTYQRYEEEKRRRGLVDFDDLLHQCARALEDDPRFAASQRWRFGHLFVDEFQDVNPVQFRLLRGWLGSNQDLCVVGDPNQAIYSWNGADPDLLSNFDLHFPGTTTVRLERNYRSSPQILALANAVLSEAGTASTVLAPDRPDGPIPSVTAYDTDTSEAQGIARRLRRAHRPGVAWSHMAVLARTNAQLVLIAEILGQSDIPFRHPSSAAFRSLPEIKMALAAIRQPGADPSLARAIKDIEAMAAEASGGGSNSGGAEDHRLNLQALVRLAREYESLDPDPDVAGFIAWLDTALRSGAGERDSDAVELATFHRAKGLEWPIVILAGLEKGFVPIGPATSRMALAEERRLLYVAMTRARSELACSWAARRSFGSRNMRREPSPYLEAIDMARTALAQGHQPGAVGAWVAESRRRLASAQADASSGISRSKSPTRARPAGAAGAGLALDADPTVLAALREWRASAARASGVPAYVIFHDSTLAALATAKPTTPAGLMDLPGLGPVKAARYGTKLLELIAREAG